MAFGTLLCVKASTINRMVAISRDQRNRLHNMGQVVPINNVTNFGSTDVHVIRATHSVLRCKYSELPKLLNETVYIQFMAKANILRLATSWIVARQSYGGEVRVLTFVVENTMGDHRKYNLRGTPKPICIVVEGYTPRTSRIARPEQNRCVAYIPIICGTTHARTLGPVVEIVIHRLPMYWSNHNVSINPGKDQRL